MHNFEIRKADGLTREMERDLIPLFQDMYLEMRDKGLMLDLADDGEEKWLDSLKRSLNRFSCLFLLYDSSRLIGFASGSMAITNDYLGSEKIGVIRHVYVVKEFRRNSLARKLVGKMEDWFFERKVHSVELQVLYLNNAAIEFWKKLNYSEELLQMRKFSAENS